MLYGDGNLLVDFCYHCSGARVVALLRSIRGSDESFDKLLVDVPGFVLCSDGDMMKPCLSQEGHHP